MTPAQPRGLTTAWLAIAAALGLVAVLALQESRVVRCSEKMAVMERFANEVRAFQSSAGRNPGPGDLQVPARLSLLEVDGSLKVSLAWGFDEWYELDVASGAWDSVYGDGAARCRADVLTPWPEGLAGL